MPEIRLIGLDLDGTLLRKDNSVSDAGMYKTKHSDISDQRTALLLYKDDCGKNSSIRKGDFL